VRSDCTENGEGACCPPGRVSHTAKISYVVIGAAGLVGLSVAQVSPRVAGFNGRLGYKRLAQRLGCAPVLGGVRLGRRRPDPGRWAGGPTRRRQGWPDQGRQVASQASIPCQSQTNDTFGVN
jgi:hypothetical protein